jgi:hypothetical protein
LAQTEILGQTDSQLDSSEQLAQNLNLGAAIAPIAELNPKPYSKTSLGGEHLNLNRHIAQTLVDTVIENNLNKHKQLRQNLSLT